MRYVIARNHSKRPTLQHLVLNATRFTACGVPMTDWSRAYQNEPIPAILCLKCRRIGDA